MSVVHQLSSGWLLDHLSFINKINYHLCQHHKPCCGKNEPTSSVHFDSLQMDSLSSFGPSATYIASDLTTKPENDDRGNSDVLLQNYVFRSELFDVTKPYITSTGREECQQSNEKEDLMDGVKKEISTSIIGKKRKRCVVFNQGELDAMEYHAKIRNLILDGSSQLVQEGLKSGFLYPLSEKQDECSEHITLPLDTCSLSELCEMAKHLPSLYETELQILRLMEDDMSVTEQDLFSRVVENSSSFTKMITLMGQKYLVPPRSSFLLSDISCMQPLLNCRKKYDVIVIDPPWQNKSVKRSNSSWSVEMVAEWHWVKITKSGEFVFPLDSLHKKPYEGLVLGRVREKTALPLRNADEKVLPIPDHKLIVSVPCTLHSHKPPLAEILKDYIKQDGEYLELFARNLQPGWTSWGNEVLKFQHVDYFIAMESGN
ncbi:N(6)-adenine-specific methyltransferase METTL4 [Trichechus manatus latirostris]|uniref:N(6)-adenine-specific methyltransferase METTL4 n=1 Tax=Trichechus manatus latirostris TaxID=127582 RepID=A0A2Y9S2N0_TRIMA|nr:N(6)-adenine-specific methyltransferase METTL4 [Trichechus manatus latirostris]